MGKIRGRNGRDLINLEGLGLKKKKRA